MALLFQPRRSTVNRSEVYLDGSDSTVESYTETETTYKPDPKTDRIQISRSSIVLERGQYYQDREILRIDEWHNGMIEDAIIDLLCTLQSISEDAPGAGQESAQKFINRCKNALKVDARVLLPGEV